MIVTGRMRYIFETMREADGKWLLPKLRTDNSDAADALVAGGWARMVPVSSLYWPALELTGKPLP